VTTICPLTPQFYRSMFRDQLQLVHVLKGKAFVAVKKLLCVYAYRSIYGHQGFTCYRHQSKADSCKKCYQFAAAVHQIEVKATTPEEASFSHPPLICWVPELGLGSGTRIWLAHGRPLLILPCIYVVCFICRCWLVCRLMMCVLS